VDAATSAITDKYTAHVSGKLIAMNVARPYSSIATTLEGDVLVVLARVSEPLTGRQVAGLVAPHGSQPAVNSALDRLTRQGLVLRQRAGRANLHTINRQHLGYAAVEALESIRARLISQLRTSFSDWPNRKAKRAPLHGSLFGSTARADGDDGSDIDLFLVRPDAVAADDADWTERIASICRSLESWTGNQVNLVELPLSSLSSSRSSNRAVLEEIERDQILLCGAPLADLLKRSQ